MFVAIDDLPKRVRQQAAPYIHVPLDQLEENADLAFVDGYSALAGVESKERYKVTDAKDLGGLTDLLAGFAREGYSAFFLDSLTTLAAMSGPADLARGLVTLVARLKSDGGTIFLTAGQSLFESGTAQLRHFSDALLEFRYSGSLTTDKLMPLGISRWLRGPSGPQTQADPLREFRFYKARGRPIYAGWIPFVVGKDALLIALPDNPVAIQQIHDEVTRLEKMV